MCWKAETLLYLVGRVCIVKAMVFSVVIYDCESWTIKKVECWRIDAFKLWSWSRLTRARRSNQLIFKEINPEYSLKGLMLKLKLQYFDHLMWRADSLEKSLMLGKIEGRRRRGIRGWDGWMTSLMQWTWTWANFGRWWRTGRAGVLQSIGSQGVRHNNCRLSICRFLVVWVTGYETEKLA